MKDAGIKKNKMEKEIKRGNNRFFVDPLKLSYFGMWMRRRGRRSIPVICLYLIIMKTIKIYIIN